MKNRKTALNIEGLETRTSLSYMPTGYVDPNTTLVMPPNEVLFEGDLDQVNNDAIVIEMLRSQFNRENNMNVSTEDVKLALAPWPTAEARSEPGFYESFTNNLNNILGIAMDSHTPIMYVY
jgi:hypothetical protein